MGSSAKVKSHSPKQIIGKLLSVEQLLNQGQSVAEVCRALEVSPATFQSWQHLQGGMKPQRPNASSRKASSKQ